MGHKLVALVAGVLGLVVGSATLRSDGPQPPPEIQAILDKRKHGGALTADDIRKLQEWAQGVAQHLPANAPTTQPGGASPGASDAGIPARFDLQLHFTRTTSGGNEDVHMTAWSPVELHAKVNGTGDYMAGLLDPSSKISSFLFVRGADSGDGHYDYKATFGKERVALSAQILRVGAGVMLVTLGGDQLGVIPGTIGGEVKGTYEIDGANGKHLSSPYDGDAKEVRFHLLFPWEEHVTKDPKKPYPHPRVQISYRQLVAAVQGTGSTAIPITEHFDWDDHGEKVAGDVTLTITLRPPRVQARLVADTDWDSWIPEGPTPKQPHGNTFSAHLELVDGATGAPWTGAPRPALVTYELQGVSKLPGVCGNWPAKGSPGYDEKPDLFFAETNTQGKVTDGDRALLQLDAREWNAKVIVESRDFAASGQLVADVKLDTGQIVTARFDKSSTPYLPLPRDDDGNHISDAWKPGLGLDAAADEEDKPQIRTPGDGLTVMEEYRGFLVSKGRKPIPANDEEHTRLDPKTRELIVAIEVDAGKPAQLVERGIEIFEQSSGIKVVAVASKDRMGPHTGDQGRPRASVLNAAPAGSHSAEATYGTVGVWITSKAEQPPAVARALPLMSLDECAKHPLDCLGTPASIRYIAIGSMANSVDTVGWLIAMVDPDQSLAPAAGPKTRLTKQAVDAYLRDRGISLADRRAAGAAGRAHTAALADELSGFSIGHELGHAVGAQHHGTFNNRPEDVGDWACPMRYWQQVDATFATNNKAPPTFTGWAEPPLNATLWLKFLTGAWNPLTDSPNGPWKYCDENLPQMSVRP